MSLEKSQLGELLDVAKTAALAAGKIVSAYQGQKIETKVKAGGSSLASQVVTEVDLRAQEAILDILSPTLESYDLGLLTEEGPDDQSRFKRDYFWCIDPLDGTLPFSKNESGYSTSIALVSKEGEALIGVVYDPREEQLYYAVKGEGAFKNNLPLKVDETEKELTLIEGTGGAVMQALKTIELSPCLFYKRPKKEEGGGCLWDYAATSVIHREAGGLNSDFGLNPLNLNSADSLYMNHCGIIYASGLSEQEIRKALSN